MRKEHKLKRVGVSIKIHAEIYEVIVELLTVFPCLLSTQLLTRT